MANRRAPPGSPLALMLGLALLACGEPHPGGEAPGEPSEPSEPEPVRALLAGAGGAPAQVGPAYRLRSSLPAARDRASLRIDVDPADGSLAVASGQDEPVLVARRLAATPPRSAGIKGHVLELEGVAPSVDARLFSRPHGVEDLWVVHAPGAALGYRFELPAGWRLDQDAPQVVELVDPTGSPRYKLVAAGAWDARGEQVPSRFALEGGATARVILEAAGATYPLYVDPELKVGGALAFDRYRHTVTSTLDGQVLVAGGAVPSAESSPYCEATPVPIESFDVRTLRFDVLGDALTPRCEHTATLQRDGRVLLAGGRVWSDGAVETLDSVELLDAESGEVEHSATLASPRARHTATRLRDGRVLIVGGEQLDPAGARVPLSSCELWDPATSTLSPAPALSTQRSDHTATLLPDGRVLVAGGFDGEDVAKTAELFDPASESWSPLPGLLATERAAHAATLSHDGEVVLWGGSSQTTGSLVEERIDALTLAHSPIGAPVVAGTQPLLFPHPREPALVRNGVVYGGDLSSPGSEVRAVLLPFARAYTMELGSAVAVAELVDADQLFTQTGGGIASRGEHSATVLASGRILLAGGSYVVDDVVPYTVPQLVVEELDPLTGVTTQVGPMARARAGHTATRLDDGRVLVVGGWSPTGGDLRTAELYDPSAQQFSDTDRIQIDRAGHTATRLPNGDVLIAGGSDDPLLERYVVARGELEAAGELVQARRGNSATRLRDGRVAIAGGGTALIELYDPRSGALSSAGTMKHVRTGHAAALLPDGSLLLAGGIVEPGSQWTGANAEIWDPITQTSREPLEPLDPGVPARGVARAANLPSGDVVVCAPLCRLYRPTLDAFRPLPGACATPSCPLYAYPGSTLTRALDGSLVLAGSYEGYFDPVGSTSFTRLRPRPPFGIPPVLTAYPAPLPAGQATTLLGLDLLARTEATNGTTFAAAADHPIAVWMPADDGLAALGGVRDFEPGSARWEAPTTPFPGLGTLAFSTAGAEGPPAPVTVLGALDGTPCTAGESCASGHCADGVCCDDACGGCEACTALAKGGGVDGVCGPIPEGAPPRAADDCLPQPLSECGRTGVCDGLGACATVPEGVECVPGAACTAGACVALALTCAGHSLVAGADEVVDCAPYRCVTEGPACLTRCASTLDCAPDHVCSVEGSCEPRLAPPEEAPGCAQGRGARSSWLLAAAGLLALVARRRLRVATPALAALLTLGCGSEPSSPLPAGGGGQTSTAGGGQQGGQGEGGEAVSAQCGDGVREGAEACDGADLGGATCQSLGLDGGTPHCRYDCTLDASSCVGCGNGYLDPGEECDGATLLGATCLSLAPPEWLAFISVNFEEYSEYGSYVSGAPSCSAECTLDTTTCGYCFDGVLNGDELCDDSDFPNGPSPPILQGATCESVAPETFVGGELYCAFCFGPDAYWTDACERPAPAPCPPGENCSLVLGYRTAPIQLLDGGDLSLAAGPLTVEGWFRVDELVPFCTIRVQRASWPEDPPGNLEWGLGTVADGAWAVTRGPADASAEEPLDLYQRADAYGAFVPGTWVHLAAVFDSDQGQTRLYVGGTLADVAPLDLGEVTGDPRLMLAQPCTNTGFTWGRMDELRISSGARYEADFSPALVFTPDAATLALYHCDESDGYTLVDSSGYGRDADLGYDPEPQWSGEHP